MSLRSRGGASPGGATEWDLATNVAADTDCTMIVWMRAVHPAVNSNSDHARVVSGVNGDKFTFATPGGGFGDFGLAWRFYTTTAVGAWGVYDAAVGGLQDAPDVGSRFIYNAAYSDQANKDVGLAVRGTRSGRIYRLRRNAGSPGSGGTNRNWGKFLYGASAAGSPGASPHAIDVAALFEGQLSSAFLSWLALRPANVWNVAPRAEVVFRIEPGVRETISTGNEQLATSSGLAGNFPDPAHWTLPPGRRSRASRFGRNAVVVLATTGSGIAALGVAGVAAGAKHGLGAGAAPTGLAGDVLGAKHGLGSGVAPGALLGAAIGAKALAGTGVLPAGVAGTADGPRAVQGTAVLPAGTLGHAAGVKHALGAGDAPAGALGVGGGAKHGAGTGAAPSGVAGLATGAKHGTGSGRAPVGILGRARAITVAAVGYLAERMNRGHNRNRRV